MFVIEKEKEVGCCPFMIFMQSKKVKLSWGIFWAVGIVWPPLHLPVAKISESFPHDMFIDKIKFSQFVFYSLKEAGGYFIINGIEKIIRMLILPRRNFVSFMLYRIIAQW